MLGTANIDFIDLVSFFLSFFHDDSNICSSDTSSSMAKIQGVEGLENTQFYIYLQYCKQCDILILHYSGYV